MALRPTTTVRNNLHACLTTYMPYWKVTYGLVFHRCLEHHFASLTLNDVDRSRGSLFLEWHRITWRVCDRQSQKWKTPVTLSNWVVRVAFLHKPGEDEQAVWYRKGQEAASKSHRCHCECKSVSLKPDRMPLIRDRHTRYCPAWYSTHYA